MSENGTPQHGFANTTARWNTLDGALVGRPHRNIEEYGPALVRSPSYASWLTQIERWFGVITQQAIRRGSSSDVNQLVTNIEHFVDHYNAEHCPFVWTAAAESVLAKDERICTVISRTTH